MRSIKFISDRDQKPHFLNHRTRKYKKEHLYGLEGVMSVISDEMRVWKIMDVKKGLRSVLMTSLMGE